MEEIHSKELEVDFTKEYRIIDLATEYPGYHDDIPYAIVTELSEEEFNSAFGEETKTYRPCIFLSKEMYAAFVGSRLCDERERLRDIFYHEALPLESMFTLVDEMASPVRICESLFTIEEIFRLMKSLPDHQGSRIYRHCVVGYTVKEIADQDGVIGSAIYQSITIGLPKVHDIFVKLGVVA